MSGCGSERVREASRFIVGFGLVSMLMDVVYEGALSVQGRCWRSLGATAATVGHLGLGEATSLAGRLVTAPLADRVGRYWLFAIAGYAITALAVPAMGWAGSVLAVGVLVVVERLGKAVRTPSRDAMISHASAAVAAARALRCTSSWTRSVRRWDPWSYRASCSQRAGRMPARSASW